ncbi:MAG: hypothetical protein M1826_004849 [Phylliscum demangeonii]|nr:MAG: hypothetical protein M1826_004849 [Phylliscum demangeonii]
MVNFLHAVMRKADEHELYTPEFAKDVWIGGGQQRLARERWDQDPIAIAGLSTSSTTKRSAPPLENYSRQIDHLLKARVARAPQSALGVGGRSRGNSDASPPLHDPLQALHDAEAYLVPELLSPEDIVGVSAVYRPRTVYIEGYV